jgi:hypothetical protein
MDIGKQQRIIQVEPEPITAPPKAPASAPPEPALVPDREREEAPATA